MHDLTLILLTIAALISIVLGARTEGWPDGYYDGFAILLAVFVCVNVTAINDLQKDKQFRALNAINNRKMIKVLRDGKMQLVVTDDLVVGDIVEIAAGDTVPADGYYLSGNKVRMDESKLTGESDQVEKGDKNPFIVSSTECHEGSLKMVVTAVGQNSVFGRMRSMIESDNDEDTPLQIKLAKLAQGLSVIGALVALLTVVVMIGF